VHFVDLLLLFAVLSGVLAQLLRVLRVHVLQLAVVELLQLDAILMVFRALRLRLFFRLVQLLLRLFFVKLQLLHFQVHVEPRWLLGVHIFHVRPSHLLSSRQFHITRLERLSKALTLQI